MSSTARISNMPGPLPVEAQLGYVRQGKGQSGDCTDYVMSTLAHLREMDIHDHLLESLAEKLGGKADDT